LGEELPEIAGSGRTQIAAIHHRADFLQHLISLRRIELQVGRRGAADRPSGRLYGVKNRESRPADNFLQTRDDDLTTPVGRVA